MIRVEVKIIEKTDTELRVEIRGESHTLLNSLKATLLEDDDVVIATYDIEHPTISEPVLYVKTAAESPIKALTKACDRLMEITDEFKDAFTAE